MGTAMAVLVASSNAALADEPLLTSDQRLENNQLELGNIEYDNAISANLDVSTGPSDVLDLHQVSGDSNLQDNAFALTLTSGKADSVLEQSLIGQVFNRDSGELANTRLRNSIDVTLSADSLAGTVGFNAAAGAFNIQKNAAAIAALPGAALAQTFADVKQLMQQNVAIQHDVVNTITATFPIENLSGNLGVNLAAGVGNVQMNTVTTALITPAPQP